MSSVLSNPVESPGVSVQAKIAVTAKKIPQVNRLAPATQFSLSQLFRMALQRDLKVLNII